jgi:hypothetical protein
LLLDVARDPRPMRRDALRVAHAVAATQAPAVVLVRRGGGAAEAASVGLWGDDRAGFATRARAALDDLGVPAVDAPIDLATREMAGRAFLEDGPVVVVSADAPALRAASLDGARSASRAFGGEGLALLDGDAASVAERLASTLPSGGAAAPADLADVVRQAATERSVVARRALAEALAKTSTRGALARSPQGELLVVVGRRGAGLVTASAPTEAP